jgi:iron complex transport system substrate-binding protein
MRQIPTQTPSPTARRGSSLPAELLAAVLALALAACTPGSSASPSSAPPSDAGAASPSAAAAFPVTLIDDEGTAVTIRSRPTRIASLSPANTETVYALGGGDRLVGGTDFDDYPPEAAALPDVATFQGVNMEQLVAADPDVVLAAGNDLNPPADIARIRELGIPVLVLYPEDVPGVLHDIELIGRAIGEGEAATAMTADMQARIDAISAATAAVPQPRVFYELGAEPELYGPADESFVADMVTLAGGEPITTGSTTAFSLSLERLVDEDPEVIVLGDANYGTTVEQVLARPGWDVMAAVRTGDIRPVDDIIVTRPGPRLAEGLAALALAIHPDLELPSPEP